MSRSKHTDPSGIRAARRLRDPFEDRGTGDLSLRRRHGQRLKELGVTTECHNEIGQNRYSEPQILIQKAAPGFCHPVTKKETLNLLRAVGPIALYGLRTVELIRAPAGGALLFGRYKTPGRIVLYQQPVPPWRLTGILKRKDARRLKRSGAIVTPQRGSGATLVDWPDDSLQRFMLEEVLLHELGHHVLQQHKGKRPVRTSRAKDHEAFAARFAARERLRIRKGGAPPQ